MNDRQALRKSSVRVKSLVARFLRPRDRQRAAQLAHRRLVEAGRQRRALGDAPSPAPSPRLRPGVRRRRATAGPSRTPRGPVKMRPSISISEATPVPAKVMIGSISAYGYQSPRLRAVMPMRMPSPPTRKSHIVAMPAPPPRQWPMIIATTGCWHSRIDCMLSSSTCAYSASRSSRAALLLEGGDVGAGAECLVAGAAQHDAAQLVVGRTAAP